MLMTDPFFQMEFEPHIFDGTFRRYRLRLDFASHLWYHIFVLYADLNTEIQTLHLVHADEFDQFQDFVPMLHLQHIL